MLPTSADMKAKVLNPPKNPTNTDTSSMKPERANMAARRAMSLKWLQNGVLGEKDNCKTEHIQLNYRNRKKRSQIFHIDKVYEVHIKNYTLK